MFTMNNTPNIKYCDSLQRFMLKKITFFRCYPVALLANYSFVKKFSVNRSLTFLK